MLRDVVFEPAESEADEFTVSYWKVDPGGEVRRGDELVVVESVEDKTAFVVLAPHTGVLTHITAGENETVVPGVVLGRIDAE